jgi:dihydrofolate synthase/folylpolyglutamate synthase
MHSSDDYLTRFLALHPKLIDLKLDRIERLLQALGSPHEKLPPVIHVGGTNGKGSTVAFMRAILEAAGLKVHVYTSPHLVRFHERIRLGAEGGGRYVAEAVLADAFRRCEEANQDQPITIFEITTAASLLLFSEHPADVLLLEVGLGGRYDATNVIAKPRAAVVTPVSMDHAEFLGDNVAKIAAEKAGIFKRGVPAVIAKQEYDDALTVLEDLAEKVRAIPVVFGQQFSVQEEGGRLVYQDEDGLLDLPLPKLAGRHQHINAGTAIAALRAGGFAHLPVSAFEKGLENVSWPARLQRITRGTLHALLPADSEFWLDGGHNPDGGKALATFMAEREDAHDRPMIMVVGMLGTKDSLHFLENFEGLAARLIAVPIKDQAAARTPEDVVALAVKNGLKAETAPSASAALERIGREHHAIAPRVLVTGSLYLAGEVLGENGTPPE